MMCFRIEFVDEDVEDTLTREQIADLARYSGFTPAAEAPKDAASGRITLALSQA